MKTILVVAALLFASCNNNGTSEVTIAGSEKTADPAIDKRSLNKDAYGEDNRTTHDNVGVHDKNEDQRAGQNSNTTASGTHDNTDLPASNNSDSKENLGKTPGENNGSINSGVPANSNPSGSTTGDNTNRQNTNPAGSSVQPPTPNKGEEGKYNGSKGGLNDTAAETGTSTTNAGRAAPGRSGSTYDGQKGDLTDTASETGKSGSGRSGGSAGRKSSDYEGSKGAINDTAAEIKKPGLKKPLSNTNKAGKIYATDKGALTDTISESSRPANRPKAIPLPSANEGLNNSNRNYNIKIRNNSRVRNN